MKKSLFVTLVAAALLLAACAGATTPGAETVQAVQSTVEGVATDVAPTVEAAAPTVEAAVTDAAGLCPGVDITALTTAGAGLYAEQCASCHGAAGEGVGSFPALANNTAVTAEDATELITSYFAVDAHPKTIAPDQLAGLMSFIRSDFNGGVAAVCPGLIEQVQPSQ